MPATTDLSRASAPPGSSAWSRVAGSGLWPPLAIYLLARLVDAGFMAWASTGQVSSDLLRTFGPGSYFVFEDLPADPGILGVATTWDGQFYGLIATEGYGSPGDYSGADGDSVAHRSFAFLPGYPMLVAAVMRSVQLDFAWAAVLTSLVAGAVASVLIHRLARPHVGQLGAISLVALTSCWVGAPIFGTAYSEGLAMALLAGALLALDRRRPWVATVLIVALALTRVVTPPLAVVVAVLYWGHWRRRRASLGPVELAGAAAALVASTAGTVAWSTLVSVSGMDTGPSRFASNSGVLARGWIPSLAGTSLVLGLVPLLVLALFAATAWRRRAEWGITMTAWAIAYPAYLLLATPAVAGMVRYSLLAFPLGLLLLGPAHQAPRRRVAWVVGACAVGLALQGLWIYWAMAARGTPGWLGL